MPDNQVAGGGFGLALPAFRDIAEPQDLSLLMARRPSASIPEGALPPLWNGQPPMMVGGVDGRPAGVFAGPRGRPSVTVIPARPGVRPNLAGPGPGIGLGAPPGARMPDAGGRLSVMGPRFPVLENVGPGLGLGGPAGSVTPGRVAVMQEATNFLPAWRPGLTTTPRYIVLNAAQRYTTMNPGWRMEAGSSPGDLLVPGFWPPRIQPGMERLVLTPGERSQIAVLTQQYYEQRAVSRAMAAADVAQSQAEAPGMFPSLSGWEANRRVTAANAFLDDFVRPLESPEAIAAWQAARDASWAAANFVGPVQPLPPTDIVPPPQSLPPTNVIPPPSPGVAPPLSKEELLAAYFPATGSSFAGTGGAPKP